jgi:hypothetical protein
MNFYPGYDAPPAVANEVPLDFSSVVYYNHFFLPRFQLLYALEHILGLTHFGLVRELGKIRLATSDFEKASLLNKK